MIIAIASDHAGFEQKQYLAQYLDELGYTVIDEGPASADRVDYPDFAEKVALDVSNKKAEVGVLVCGTGIGMAISANKVNGIRATNATTTEFAQLSREHNNCNIITLSGRFVNLDENKKILDVFLNTPFAGGRHAERVNKIMALESATYNKN